MKLISKTAVFCILSLLMVVVPVSSYASEVVYEPQDFCQGWDIREGHESGIDPTCQTEIFKVGSGSVKVSRDNVNRKLLPVSAKGIVEFEAWVLPGTQGSNFGLSLGNTGTSTEAIAVSVSDSSSWAYRVQSSLVYLAPYSQTWTKLRIRVDTEAGTMDLWIDDYQFLNGITLYHSLSEGINIIGLSSGRAGSAYDSYIDDIWLVGTPPKLEPVADAGGNQVVFDEATLYGGGSYDPDGTIVDYQWILQHEEDPALKISANGVEPILTDLPSGIYNVTLTVTDNDGLIGEDTAILAAAGHCDQWPQPNAAFRIKKLKLKKNKGKNKKDAMVIGDVEIPDLNVENGDTVPARVTIELFNALPSGEDVVFSDEANLKVKKCKKRLMLMNDR